MRVIVQPEEFDRREQPDELKNHQIGEEDPSGCGNLFLPFAREEEDGDFVAEQTNRD